MRKTRRGLGCQNKNPQALAIQLMMKVEESIQMLDE